MEFEVTPRAQFEVSPRSVAPAVTVTPRSAGTAFLVVGVPAPPSIGEGEPFDGNLDVPLNVSGDSEPTVRWINTGGPTWKWYNNGNFGVYNDTTARGPLTIDSDAGDQELGVHNGSVSVGGDLTVTGTVGVAAPTDDGHAANKGYVDDAVASNPGPQGDDGPAGPAGATGPTGNAGPQGPAGATGSQGPQGDTGSTGQTGVRGSTWFTGAGAPDTIPDSLPGDMYLDTLTGTVYQLD